MGSEMCIRDRVVFLYGHGQISTLLFDRITATCGMDYLKKGTVPPPPGCHDALGQVANEVGGYFAYGLYDDCIYQEGLRSRASPVSQSGEVGGIRYQSRAALTPRVARMLGFVEEDRVSPATREGVTGAVNDYPCGGGDAQTVWTDSIAVRKALGVPVDSLFFNGDNGEESATCHRASSHSGIMMVVSPWKGIGTRGYAWAVSTRCICRVSCWSSCSSCCGWSR